jgi:hypothetical protein
MRHALANGSRGRPTHLHDLALAPLALGFRAGFLGRLRPICFTRKSEVIGGGKDTYGTCPCQRWFLRG